MKTQNQNNLKDICSESQKAKNPFSNTQECERCQGKWLFNFDTGEIVKLQCKAYKCQVCGPKKTFFLKKFIQKYIDSWQNVTLWTFTFSSHIFSGMKLQEKLQKASKIWKTFRDLIKRDKSLSEYQKSFQYLKVVELQENGSPHFHAVVDRFIRQQRINYLWHKAIQYNSTYKGTPGNANFSPPAKQLKKKNVGAYITKYIAKQIADIQEDVNFRRWSKSGKGSIFPKYEKSGNWIFLSLNLEQQCVTSAIELVVLRRNDEIRRAETLFYLDDPPKKPISDIQKDDFEYGYD